VVRPREGTGECWIARVQDGVGGDDSGEPVRVAGENTQPDRTSPVLSHEGDLVQIQAGDEPAQPVDVANKGVIRGLGQLVRATETDEVGCDDP